MRLFELFEAKQAVKGKIKVQQQAPRNFVAKYAKTSGAGSHDSKKFTRKEKHKNKTED